MKKVIMGAHQVYSETKGLDKYGTPEDIDIFNFLKKNEGQDIVFHGMDLDENFVVSQYERTRQFRVPSVCFSDSEEIIENEDAESEEEEKISFIRKYETYIIAVLIIIMIFILIFGYLRNKKTKDDKTIVNNEITSNTVQKIELTAIQINGEKQKNKLDLKIEKLEKQKIIKDQLKNLEEELDKNIQEIRTIDLEISNLREESILLTN